MHTRLKRKISKQFKVIDKFTRALEIAQENAEEVLADCALEKAEILVVESDCKRVKKTCSNILDVC